MHAGDGTTSGRDQATTAGADLAGLLERLRAAGVRVTTARRAVLEVILAAGGEHLPAEEVAQRVHTSSPQVHLSTVYRALDTLEEIGVLRRARLADGPVSYHLHSDVHHHGLCSSCGVVVELPASALAPVIRTLRDEHGFVAEPEHLTIAGLCEACAADDRG